jgi:hypothetical protein
VVAGAASPPSRAVVSATPAGTSAGGLASAAPAIVASAPPASPPTLDSPAEQAPSAEGVVATGEAPSDAPQADVVLDERPADAPEVSILFVAWSRSPADRLASMRVGSGSLSVVHEGEYVEGLQVSQIHPEAVDFQWSSQKFRVPVRPF